VQEKWGGGKKGKAVEKALANAGVEKKRGARRVVDNQKAGQ